MNIVQFIGYLNREKGWNLQGSYYAYIDQWRQWWQGNYPDFHDVPCIGADGQRHKRPMYRLRMPKQACEDWAALLLGDKTTVTVEDAASSAWLVGPEGQQTGGLLGRLDFWRNANRLVELAFRSGTGAFVLFVDKLTVGNQTVLVSPEAQLWVDYLPAECILPITVKHGRVTECAFASVVTSGGRSYIYLQTHQLTGRGYQITNEYYTAQEEEGRAIYRPAELPNGMLPSFYTGSDQPWFALFSPAQLKNLDGGDGLGMSVFAEALDQARQCDLAFDNYCRDLYLGGKKVFYNKELLQPVSGMDGQLHLIAPDSIRQQLFVQTSGDPDKDDWHEYNPDLRVSANSQAVQDALDYYSFKVGLGTHHYRFSRNGSIATATQYIGDRQDMVQHANRHQIQIEAALLTFFRTLLWAGKTILGQPVDPDTSLTINFDDSYISAAETRRQQDKDDCLSGFLPKYRYNMEWRGMSEEEAKRAVQEAAEEGTSDDDLLFGGA